MSTRTNKKTRKTKRGGVWPGVWLSNKPDVKPQENKPAQVTEQKEFEFKCVIVHYDYATYVVEIIGVLKVENCPFLFRANGSLTTDKEDGYSKLGDKIDEYFQETYPHLVAKMKSAIRDEILAKKKQIYPQHEASLKISRIEWDTISIEIDQNTIGYCVAKKLEDTITKYIVSQYALIKKSEAIGIKTKVNNKITYDGKDVDLLKSFIDYHAVLELFNKQSDLSALANLDNTNGMSGGMGTQVAATLFVVLCMAATNAISTSNTVFKNTSAVPTKVIKGQSTFLDNTISQNTHDTIKAYNAITNHFVTDVTLMTTDTMLKDVTYTNCGYVSCIDETLPSQTKAVLEEIRIIYNIPNDVKDATIITDAAKEMIGSTDFNYDDKSDILSITENKSLLTPGDAMLVLDALLNDVTNQIMVLKNEIGREVLPTQPTGSGNSVINAYNAFAKTFNEMNTKTESAKLIPFFTGDKVKINSMVDKYIEIVKLTNQLELLNEVKTMQTTIQGSSSLDVSTIDDLTTFSVRVRNQLKIFGDINTKQAKKLERTADITSHKDAQHLINKVQDGSVEFLKKRTDTMEQFTKNNMRQADLLATQDMHSYWLIIYKGVQILAGMLTLGGTLYATYASFFAMWLSGSAAGKAAGVIVENLANNVADQSTQQLKLNQIEREKALSAAKRSLVVYKKDLEKLNSMDEKDLNETAIRYGLVMDTSELADKKEKLQDRINEEIKIHESAIEKLKGNHESDIEKKAVETFKAVAEDIEKKIAAAIKIQKVTRGFLARKNTKKQPGGRKRKSVRKSRKH